MNKFTSGKERKYFPLSLILAMFYYALIFLLMQSHIIGNDENSIYTRIPFVLGVIMLFFLLVEFKNDISIPLNIIICFIWFAIAYFIAGFYGPTGIFEAIRGFFSITGIGIVLVFAARKYYLLRSFKSVMLWVGLINAIYGLLFIFLDLTKIGNFLANLNLPPGVSLDEGIRVIGLMGDPTYCGLLLMASFFISYERFLSNKTKFFNFNFISIIILAVALFLTLSRSTWVALIVGMLTWQFTSYKREWKSWFLIVIIFVVIYIILFNIEYILSSFLGRVDIDTMDTRTWVWKSYFKLALKEPFGYGLGSIESLRWYATAGQPFESTYRPHNYFLIIWLEIGIQGLLPFLVMIGLALKKVLGTLEYYDIQTREYPGRLAITLLMSFCVGIFSLGGLSQIMFIILAMCLLIDGFVKQGKLVADIKQSRIV